MRMGVGCDVDAKSRRQRKKVESGTGDFLGTAAWDKFETGKEKKWFPRLNDHLPRG
jgi:hypothetical protein